MKKFTNFLKKPSNPTFCSNVIYYFILYFFILYVFPLYLKADTNVNGHCVGRIHLLQVVECVLDHSPEYKLEKQELGSIAGRKIVSAYLFPSNPVLSFSQSLRRESGDSRTYLNGEILFSQEIFLTPQRRARMQASEIEKTLQFARIEVIRRNTIADALKSAIRYENSKLILAETKELYKLSSDLHTAIDERVKKGILPPIDSDLSESEKIKMFKILQIAKRNLNRAKADLTVMMGTPYESELQIMQMPDHLKLKELKMEALLQNAIQTRPEILLAERNIKLLQKKTDVLKLERIPNLTVSGFVQRDGLNENVVGARASVPLRIWRTGTGEILESQSKIQQGFSLLEVQTHTLKQEVIQAVSDFHSLEEEMHVYSEDTLKRAKESILGIQKAVKLGQINLKEALLTQQSLVNLKLAYLDTKRDWLISGIELLRASGYPILEVEVEK